MTVCCVIVTYGDRFDLFSQVIEAVWKEDIDKIVLVSNGSFDRSHKRALELEKRYHPVLMVHHLPDNCGSAGGFKKGLEIALQTACDYIWILDDDNKPAPGALGILKRFWVLETNEQDKQDTALSSLRKDRENYLQALLRNDPDLILQPVNNYAGFHIKTISHKIKERICPAEATPELIHLPALKLKAAAYGGLFFHKELLKKIGLPNESFVLYSDDFDFTYRIALKGGGIWLLPSSILHDVETSYYLPKQKNFYIIPFLMRPATVLYITLSGTPFTFPINTGWTIRWPDG